MTVSAPIVRSQVRSCFWTNRERVPRVQTDVRDSTLSADFTIPRPLVRQVWDFPDARSIAHPSARAISVSDNCRSWHMKTRWADDGRHYWDGTQWLPAISTDGRWRWD